MRGRLVVCNVLPQQLEISDPVLQLRTGVTMVQTEGYAALMSGVSATVARGLFYGGVLPPVYSLSCFSPAKEASEVEGCTCLHRFWTA